MSANLFAARSRFASTPRSVTCAASACWRRSSWVSDRARRLRSPRSAAVAERLTARAFENGLIVWPNTGHHLPSASGCLILVAPALTIGEGELQEIGKRLLRTVHEVLG